MSDTSETAGQDAKRVTLRLRWFRRICWPIAALVGVGVIVLGIMPVVHRNEKGVCTFQPLDASNVDAYPGNGTRYSCERRLMQEGSTKWTPWLNGARLDGDSGKCPRVRLWSENNEADCHVKARDSITAGIQDCVFLEEHNVCLPESICAEKSRGGAVSQAVICGILGLAFLTVSVAYGCLAWRKEEPVPEMKQQPLELESSAEHKSSEADASPGIPIYSISVLSEGQLDSLPLGVHDTDAVVIGRPPNATKI